jgi:hypothetical protein
MSHFDPNETSTAHAGVVGNAPILFHSLVRLTHRDGHAQEGRQNRAKIVAWAEVNMQNAIIILTTFVIAISKRVTRDTGAK